MSLFHPNVQGVGVRNHASVGEVVACFHNERSILSRLALLITGGQAMADQCVVNACEITLHGNAPFRDWLLEWAKVATITSAISRNADAIRACEAAYKDQSCTDLEHLWQVDAEQRAAGLNVILQTDPQKVIAELDPLCRTILVLRSAIRLSIQDCVLRLNVCRAAVLAANCRVMTWINELRWMAMEGQSYLRSAATSALEIRSVMLATDFSEASDKPSRHALAVARCCGAKFYLAHVVSSWGITMSGPDALALAEEAAVRDASQLLDNLARSESLNGLPREVIVRQGEIWTELQTIIREQKIDLVVIGTHGRQGVGKFLLGSVAEQIFRQADCMVLTVGPVCYQQPRVGNPDSDPTVLFPTDFSHDSLRALPCAVSRANQFGAKLVLLNILPVISEAQAMHGCTAEAFIKIRENARVTSIGRLAKLVQHAQLKIQPEFVAEFGTGVPVSEDILNFSERLDAGAIIMGLHPAKHVGMASHLPWATAYEIVSRAGCPVLTVR
jgi:nucleotide-binding universal stress UspA family protein